MSSESFSGTVNTGPVTLNEVEVLQPTSLPYFILDNEPTAEQQAQALSWRKAVLVDKWLVKLRGDADLDLFPAGEKLTAVEARAIVGGDRDWNGPNPGET